MPTLELRNLAKTHVMDRNKRLLGSTLLREPSMHAGGEPSAFDRFLGVGDLYEAFETGVLRHETRWNTAAGMREPCRARLGGR